MEIINLFNKFFQKPKKVKVLSDSSDFVELVNNGIYIDKTDLLAKIIDDRRPLVLLRPEGFGKSTLVSTLHELFAHGLKNFKGLKFVKAYEEQHCTRDGKPRPWPNKTYKVLHLDFAKCRDFSTVEQFEALLLDLLIKQIEEAGGTYDKKEMSLYKDDPVFLFAHTLSCAKSDEYVLLIDNYDAPITTALANPDLFMPVRCALSRILTLIKAEGSSLRFALITGVHHYIEGSIFSSFNNYCNLTLHYEYGSLLGFTQEDLESHFSEYLDNAVKVLDEKYSQQHPQQHYTRAQLLADLKQNYYGYCFDEDNECKVYNPWEIIQFLQAPSLEFPAYLYNADSYTSPKLIAYIKNFLHEVSPQNLTKLTERYFYHCDRAFEFIRDNLDLVLNLNATRSKDWYDILPRVEDLRILKPLDYLFQEGYFTITAKDKANYIGAPSFWDIGLSTLEVKKAYGDTLIKVLSKDENQTIACDREEFVASLKTCDLPKFQQVCNVIVNKLADDTVTVFDEIAYKDLLRIFLTCWKLQPATAVMSTFTQDDVVLSAGAYLYVVEVKIAHNEAEVTAKMAEAKQQLLARQYSDHVTTQKVIALALVVNNGSLPKKVQLG